MCGLSRRVSGQDDDYSQLFVEDVTMQYVLSTRTGSVIDLAQDPTYVILGLGCTMSMGSRYAVNKFMKAATSIVWITKLYHRRLSYHVQIRRQLLFIRL